MGVSVYPVLNKDLSCFDVTGVSGKALAGAIFEEGSTFAVLERFSSQDAEGAADFIADQTGQGSSGIEVPTEEWFAPEEGLEVVRSLQAQFQSTSHTLLAAPAGWEPDEFFRGLSDDLKTVEKVLLLAKDHNALFHLALDF